jgi:hypothetical protein
VRYPAIRCGGDLPGRLDRDRSTFEIPSLRRLIGALACDNEIDLAGVELQLQVIAGEFVFPIADQGPRLGIRIRREIRDPIRVRHENIDVVTDPMVEVRGESCAAPNDHVTSRVSVSINVSAICSRPFQSEVRHFSDPLGASTMTRPPGAHCPIQVFKAHDPGEHQVMNGFF